MQTDISQILYARVRSPLYAINNKCINLKTGIILKIFFYYLILNSILCQNFVYISKNNNFILEKNLGNKKKLKKSEFDTE